MYYYDVLPASNSYKSNTPLTYSSTVKLVQGQLINVGLRNSICAAVVYEEVTRPSFKVKEVSGVPPLPLLPARLMKLAVWMAAYYQAGIGPVMRQIVQKSFLTTNKNTVSGAASPDINISTPPQAHNQLPSLNDEQSSAVGSITRGGTYLLHGDTGTGKTRVYIELAKKSLASDKSAIILTPEIGLITQLARSFQSIFGDRVVVVHSQLTSAERRNTWQAILNSKVPLVIIGPRSALFSPVAKIGLIVIDESHDSSYKQTDSPHYSAGTVAAKLAELEDCPLILGSATPSVSDYYLASARGRPILRMTKLATRTEFAPPKAILIDIKERSNFKKSQHLSDTLVSAVDKALEAGEQSLLFLNRRGTARVVACNVCGWISTCPNCSLPLTYHADSHNLRCHSCSFSLAPPTACPDCGNSDLSFRGVGSKAIETEAKKLFPKATIKRFDADNPKKERLEQIYSSVANGEVDIIIGTQIIAKGLDLPKLSVAGMVIADTSLYLPDFPADEKTYQQIRQVIGRVGRGHRDGTAIVQTFSPNSPVIHAALEGRYTEFYRRELKERQKLSFPPATHMLKLSIKRSSARSAELAAEKLKQSILDKKLKIVVDGPAPSFHEVSGSKYSWQLIVKSNYRAQLLEALKLPLAGVSYELDPVSLL